jgi:hypothetical protein
VRTAISYRLLLFPNKRESVIDFSISAGYIRAHAGEGVVIGGVGD